MTMNRDSFDAMRIKAQRSIDLFGGDDPRAVMASAECTLAIIRDGGFRRPRWVDCPAHVPQGDDLTALMASTRSADKLQRIDAIDWRYRNELVEMEAAARLDVLVDLFRKLDAIAQRNGPERAMVHAMQHELVNHAVKHFGGARLPQCPTGRAAEAAWCRKHVAFDTPVPAWFRTRKRAPTTFAPTERGGDPTPIGGAWS